MGLDWPSRLPFPILCDGRSQDCYRAYLDENTDLGLEIHRAMHHTFKCASFPGFKAGESVENWFLEQVRFLCVRLTRYLYTPREVNGAALYF